MLMLLFYIGGSRYALAAEQVVEVISLVELQKLARSPNYLAGLLNYRSKIIPVIDLSQLLVRVPSRLYLSTRIIVVDYKTDTGKSSLLGMIAERVTETLNLQETDLNQRGERVNPSPYEGEILTDEQGMIQCLQVKSLLSQSQQRYLLPQLE